MSMSIDRAIEICNPTTESTHSPHEWLEAHRMACQALALLRWIPVTERMPEDGEYVLGVCSATLPGERTPWLENDLCIVEYSETLDEWILADDQDLDPITVSHWMRLPTLPEGVEE